LAKPPTKCGFSQRGGVEPGDDDPPTGALGVWGNLDAGEESVEPGDGTVIGKGGGGGLRGRCSLFALRVWQFVVHAVDVYFAEYLRCVPPTSLTSLRLRMGMAMFVTMLLRSVGRR
jgi:hypothetical protein